LFKNGRCVLNNKHCLLNFVSAVFADSIAVVEKAFRRGAPAGTPTASGSCVCSSSHLPPLSCTFLRLLPQVWLLEPSSLVSNLLFNDRACCHMPQVWLLEVSKGLLDPSDPEPAHPGSGRNWTLSFRTAASSDHGAAASVSSVALRGRMSAAERFEYLTTKVRMVVGAGERGLST
jgi:hypothetical protein